ncbi:MAG: XRE family transcriptional regulator [Thermodesulfobacteriota bacterium]
MTRAELDHTVHMITEKRGLKQKEISESLRIDQSEVSKLMNGKYNLFSEGWLFKQTRPKGYSADFPKAQK